MAEMIDKWGVVNKLIAMENEFQQYKPFQGFEHPMYRKVCEAEIEIGKTSGVVMVFCKDCASGKGSTHKVCPLYKQGLMKDEDFCSKGERKDNDSE